MNETVPIFSTNVNHLLHNRSGIYSRLTSWTVILSEIHDVHDVQVIYNGMFFIPLGVKVLPHVILNC